MSLFKKKTAKYRAIGGNAADLALRSLDHIAEAVLVVNAQGMIKFANPAASTMTGYGAPDNITGLDYKLVIRLEDSQQNPIDSMESELFTAVSLNRQLNTRDYTLVSAQSERRFAIDLSCIPTGDELADRIITFRDVTTELAEEREQAEFISTASHEMRTPVASIEGYLGLALNPQTATIDERARKYLEAAHASSQHLGRLFKDLLDVTKFDDSRAKIHLIPVDAVQAVSYIVNEQSKAIQAKTLRYTFNGSNNFTDKKHLSQKIYMAVDYDYLREIINNLVGNAIKYTPEGGELKVNVKGDADKVLITIADNGIGIPPEDLGHIFQKFYRVDNSQTRQIGGTGLGLYLVKQRAEALGGRVWAESDFGHGSTFYVSIPRISESEYERMRIAYGNEKMMRTPFVAPVVGTVDAKIPSAELARTATGQTGAKIQQVNQQATESIQMSSMIQSHKVDGNTENIPSHQPTLSANPDIIPSHQPSLQSQEAQMTAETSNTEQGFINSNKKVILPPSQANPNK